MVLFWALGCHLGTGGLLPPAPVATGGLAAAVVASYARHATLPLVLGGAALGGALHGSRRRQRESIEFLTHRPRGLEGPWHLRGSLLRDPEAGEDHVRLEMELDGVRVGGAWRRARLRVRTTVWEAVPPGDWRAGDRFEAFLRLRPHRAAANPGADREDRLRAAGFDARASLKSLRQLRRRTPWPRHGPLAWPHRLRAALRGAIERQFPDRAPMVAALVLGERARLSARFQADLARAGLIHLLAISGLHVGLLLGLVWLLARCAGLAPARAALVALLAVGVVATVVVPRPPVRRAALMATAALGAIAAGRRLPVTDALALAALWLTLHDPWATRDLGFQLSVVATAGIVLLPGAPTGAGWAASLLRATLAAQAAVAPLVAARTHRVALAGLPLNPLAVPLVTLALPLVLAALALDLLGLPAAAPAVLADALLGTLERLARWPQAAALDLTVSAGRSPALALFGAGLAAWCGTPGRLRRRAGCIALTLGAVAALWPVPTPGRMELVFLDIGQGDSVLVRTPDGEAVLVDVPGSRGSGFDPGSGVVAPALRALGVTRLDALVLSHLHLDHAGGAAGLLAEVPAVAVWLGSVPPEAVPATLTRPGAPALLSVVAGGRRPGARCSWEALHPGPRWTPPGGAPVENDASLVVSVACDGRRALLTGDIERPAEAAIATRTPPPGPAALVVKVPHHGSTTSSSEVFLRAFPGRHAVISAGWENRFGLPRAEVLERYRSRGVAVYRTDRDGAVTVETGRRIRVRGARWTSGRGRR